MRKRKIQLQLCGRTQLRSQNFTRLSTDEAKALERPFDEGEIWAAIKDCGSNKSSGSDGFTFSFLKKFWDTIKEDLIKALSWFWEKEEIGLGCNSAFLTLIPKMDTSLHLGDFWPISLIGVYYKILAKLLAERIKGVMAKLINPSQSVFLKGRFILDGVLIANEVVDYVRKKKKSSLIFKVDFEKAYDSVEWLVSILDGLGASKWVANKGIPYEKRFKTRGSLSPVLIPHRSGKLTHLSEKYEGEGLIQRNQGVPEEVVISWATSTGCGFEKLPFVYLGLPVGASMKRLDHWKPAVGKIKKRIDSWKARFVSFGGRLTLVKSVLGSLPLYYFSLFRALSGVLKECESARCTTWSTIIHTGKIMDSKGTSFSKAFEKKVGNEKETLLWKDRWLGTEALQEAFPRLFRLEDEKTKIADRGEWVNGEWEWNWLDRIPCRFILDKRGIDLNSLLCPRCDEVVETVDHALVTCPEVKKFWCLVSKWWNKDLEGANSVQDVLQADNTNSMIEGRDKVWAAVKMVCDVLHLESPELLSILKLFF
ncbi:hypothetical protein OSB04_027665 [Centaurea solstitialis]|uniref:Reverse transcriptase domain-containing protein n=1 Tax=Centaurea solstitialis TaxID=347529 RepID=A0AA38W8H8_9ASTR|nr:hypothetical protein OSB04_027665 [Centaurea solstitialis]